MRGLRPTSAKDFREHPAFLDRVVDRDEPIDPGADRERILALHRDTQRCFVQEVGDIDLGHRRDDILLAGEVAR